MVLELYLDLDLLFTTFSNIFIQDQIQTDNS